MNKVTYENLQEWYRLFQTALSYNKGYLYAYHTTLLENALFIQYLWKEEPWEEQPYVHEILIKEGDSFSFQQCLNESRLIRIYGHQRKLRAWKDIKRNEVLITVGGKCDRDCAGDGNNPYSVNI